MSLTESADGLQNAPWYVAVFVRVGLPASFAVVLLWFLMTNVTGSLSIMQANQARIIETQAQVVLNQGKIIELLTDHAGTTMINTYLLQAMCYNAAKTPAEQARCADAFRPAR